MSEDEVLARITVNRDIFGGKPIIRGMRIAVEDVLGMLAAGDTPEGLIDERLSWNPPTSRRAWRSAGGM